MAVMKRQRRDAREWGRLVREQRASGLSVARFCRRARVSPATFYAWRRRLRDARDARQGAADRFVEVKIAAGDAAEATSDAPAEAMTEIPADALPDARRGGPLEAASPVRPLELRLRDGHRVLIPASFDPRTLRELLAVLERDALPAAAVDGWAVEMEGKAWSASPRWLSSINRRPRGSGCAPGRPACAGGADAEGVWPIVGPPGRWGLGGGDSSRC